MIFTKPTKRGIGVELWGTKEDLQLLQDFTYRYHNRDEFKSSSQFVNRDILIRSFTFELSDAIGGSLLKSNKNPVTSEPIEYLGAKFTWVHFLFVLSALRFNSQFLETNKLDKSYFLQIEYWLEQSMIEYDAVGAQQLIPFITNEIFPANPYLNQLMNRINAEFFHLGGGIEAFRKLPELMQKSRYNGIGYSYIEAIFYEEAEKRDCPPELLYLAEDDVDWDTIEW